MSRAKLLSVPSDIQKRASFQIEPKGIKMNRFRALLKETWWLWALFSVAGVALSLFSPVFLTMFPICIFVFFWFAYIRFGDNGEFKGS
ncbi:MAG: hypothetical protein Aurels2KO_10220 [Aureliella sp.]